MLENNDDEFIKALPDSGHAEPPIAMKYSEEVSEKQGTSQTTAILTCAEETSDAKQLLFEESLDDLAVQEAGKNDDFEQGHDQSGNKSQSDCDQEWYHMFQKLLRYKNEHGDCNVQRTCQENSYLWDWVEAQKREYKSFVEGRINALTPDRIEMLNSLDFVCPQQHCESTPEIVPSRGDGEKQQNLDTKGKSQSSRDDKWQRMFQELQRYKEKHGDCLVPTLYPNNRELSTFVHAQRRAYREKVGGKSNFLNEERINALNSLGFIWIATRGRKPKKSASTVDCGDEDYLSASSSYQDDDPTVFPDGDNYDSGNGQASAHDPPNTNALGKPEAKVPRSSEDQWKEMFEQLNQYKRENGDCLVPKCYPEKPELTEWVKVQRKAYKQGMEGKSTSLTKARTDALNLIGFVWEDVRVKKRKQSDPVARCAKGSKDLTTNPTVKEKKKDKNAEARWWAMLGHLKQYKEEHGDCNVPRSYEKHPQLGEWCKTQKRTYNERLQGKMGPMTKERIDALEQVGFQWASTRPRKRKAAQAAVVGEDGKQSHGNVGQASNFQDKESCFVMAEVDQYMESVLPVTRLMSKFPEIVSQSTENTRNSLGFETKSNGEKSSDDWSKMFIELRKYKEVHGNCIVPTCYKENPELAEWCRMQRHAKKDRRAAVNMTEERIELLDTLGFSWVEECNTTDDCNSYKPKVDDAGDPIVQSAPSVHQKDTKKSVLEPVETTKFALHITTGDEQDLPAENSPAKRREDKWQQMFVQLQTYREKHGDCHVPRPYKDNPKLGEWCKTQKRSYKAQQDGKSKAMTPERIASLQALGFSFATGGSLGTGASTGHKPLRMKGSTECPPMGAETNKISKSTKVKGNMASSIVHLNDDRWQEMLGHLKAYKAEFGDCLVPRSYNKNSQLGEWVKTQRRKYKLQMEGKSNAMTRDRIEALEALDFSWVVKSGRKPVSGKKDDATTFKQADAGQKVNEGTTLRKDVDELPVVKQAANDENIETSDVGALQTEHTENGGDQIERADV